jgi:hypothetical protein
MWIQVKWLMAVGPLPYTSPGGVQPAVLAATDVTLIRVTMCNNLSQETSVGVLLVFQK